MIRALALSGIAALGLTLPAMADTVSSVDPAKSAAFSAELSNTAAAQQARIALAHQGYTAISALERNENGRWVGTAVKNGKTVAVAVVLPNPSQQSSN